MIKYCADFETTTDIYDCRVWACGIVDIDTHEVEYVGNNIDDFMEIILKKKAVVYFHNLKFDGKFILSWLLHNGYKYDGDLKSPKSFRTLISDMGVFYSIEVMDKYYKGNKSKCINVKFLDSLKKLPFKVSQIAKTFGIEEQKLEIDYKAYRSKDHELTMEEREYLKNDIVIVSKALKTQFDKGLDKMTIASDSLCNFKDVIGKQYFKYYFPILEYSVDEFLRKSYKGGFTWLNPKKKGIHGDGITYDVNSLYPSVMLDRYLPIDEPVAYEGEYEEDKHYPLYVEECLISFKLKPDHVPCIQVKNNMRFCPTDYLESSEGDIIKMVITSVDKELIFKQYDVVYYEAIKGYKFRAVRGLFTQYIEYWRHIKETTKDKGERQLAKLMLNSLYGKFGKNPKADTKKPYLDDNGVVKYELQENDLTESIYVAMASFITAYAREQTISTAQSVFDRFIYADTDSIHLVGHEIPNIDIDDSRFGAWKCEGKFTQAKFIRAKTYMEKYDFGWDVKCAGMPEACKEQVTLENFEEGSTFHGKLVPKEVKGGVVLVETDFTIKLG